MSVFFSWLISHSSKIKGIKAEEKLKVLSNKFNFHINIFRYYLTTWFRTGNEPKTRKSVILVGAKAVIELTKIKVFFS